MGRVKKIMDFQASLLVKLMFCLLAAAVFSCSEPAGKTFSLQSRIYESDSYYEVTGIGAAAVENDISEAEARMNAETVAYVQAVEILAEVIQGIAVEGDIRLRDLAIHEGELSQLIKVRLENIRQAGPTRFEQEADASLTAAYTIRHEKTYAAMIAESIREKRYSGPNSESNLLNQEYSGIVLDLRYVTGFDSFLAPKICGDDGVVFFSVRDIDPEVLVATYGIPVFSTIYEAVYIGAVGPTPLKLVPDSFNTENGALILSEKDTRKVESISDIRSLVYRGKLALII